jgi:hypothetical protein
MKLHGFDPVCHLAGKRHFMRHQDHGHPIRSELLHDAQNLTSELRVERRRDLVEQHQLGLHGKAAGNCHALLLPAGELLRIAVHLTT